jgi:ribosomal protein S18 acetylase RimI-like enzyme
MLGLIQAWNTGFIKDLGVRVTRHRAGVGRALVEAICARFRANGLAQVSLKVVSDNHKALRFYEALGFERA